MRHILNSGDSIRSILKICKAGDTIFLKKGIYNEKIEILIDDITIIGEDEKETIITNHDFYHKIMEDYNECNTFRTYTCYVGGNGITLSNLTVENSSIPSRKYGQAVALHVQGTRFTCNNVTLTSAQDTLFTAPLPENLQIKYQGFMPSHFLNGTVPFQKYTHCTIKGDVDFIFGGAVALFEECNIVSIGRDKSVTDPNGYLCAPSHIQSLPFGYLFYKCNLTYENDASNIFLGRPWRDYGCAAFIECIMPESRINPLGFNKWGNTNRDKTARFYEYSPNVNCSKREPWVHLLDESSAKEYLDEFFSYFSTNF